MSRIRRSSSNAENLPIHVSSASTAAANTTLNTSAFKRSGAETPSGHKYEATRKWNTMIASFCDEVAMEDHRRFFKSYPNTFTGQAAADCLSEILPRIFTDRKCERTNAVRVLQKFIDDRVIEEISGLNEFKDDASLYRLTDGTKLKYGLVDPPPAKIRRSASLNERDHRSTPASCSASAGLRSDYSRPVKLTNFHLKTSQNFSFNGSHADLNLSLRTPCRAVQLKQAESPPARLDQRFAQVDLNADDLESRRQFLDIQLLGLLDGIISDIHLGEMERHRKLMEFKNNYPKIFAIRYPENTYQPPPTPLLHRIKDFLGGN